MKKPEIDMQSKRMVVDTKTYAQLIDALVDEYKELSRELPFRHKGEQPNVSARMAKIKTALRDAGVVES